MYVSVMDILIPKNKILLLELHVLYVYQNSYIVHPMDPFHLISNKWM